MQETKKKGGREDRKGWNLGKKAAGPWMKAGIVYK